MTLTAIQKLVEKVAGCKIIKSRQTAIINARYVFLLLAVEENHSKRRIKIHLELTRDTLNNSLAKADSLLQVDKPFKALYLKCIKKITENEE